MEFDREKADKSGVRYDVLNDNRVAVTIDGENASFRPMIAFGFVAGSSISLAWCRKDFQKS